MLVEADVDSHVGVARQLAQGSQFFQPQEGRIVAKHFSRLLLRLEDDVFGLGLDAGGFGVDFLAQSPGLGFRLGLAAPGVGSRLGLDLLHFSLCSGFNELRLRVPLRGQYPVHDLLQVAGKDEILDVGTPNSNPVAGGRFLDVGY